jgi:hypothetical protein
MMGHIVIWGRLVAVNTKRQVKSNEVYISMNSLGHGKSKEVNRCNKQEDN